VGLGIVSPAAFSGHSRRNRGSHRLVEAAAIFFSLARVRDGGDGDGDGRALEFSNFRPALRSRSVDRSVATSKFASRRRRRRRRRPVTDRLTDQTIWFANLSCARVCRPTDRPTDRRPKLGGEKNRAMRKIKKKNS
jgi:hypothetical protein